jgi:hypothetical protein
MAARKRKEGESYGAYRKNLKDEAAWLRGRLRGGFFYQLREDPRTGKFMPYRRGFR